MTRKRDLTAEEADAWSRVVASVKPIGARDKDLKKLMAALIPDAGDAREEAPVPKTSSLRGASKSDTPSAKTPTLPADRGGEKRVRRGRIDLTHRLDLHGHTQSSAERAVAQYLSHAREDGARTVLVITGKGRRGESVIRRNFLDWLASPAARTHVSGYAEAHARHGGAGAFYVFLRKLS